IFYRAISKTQLISECVKLSDRSEIGIGLVHIITVGLKGEEAVLANQTSSALRYDVLAAIAMSQDDLGSTRIKTFFNEHIAAGWPCGHRGKACRLKHQVHIHVS